MRVEFDTQEYLDGYKAVIRFGTPSAVKALRDHPDYQPVQYTAWDTCEEYGLERGCALMGIAWSFAELDRYLCGLAGGDYDAEKAAQGADAAYTDFCMTSEDAQYSFLLGHPDAEPRYYQHLCRVLGILVNDDTEPAEMLDMIREAL